MEQYISNNQWKSYVGVFTKANSGRAPAPAALDDLRPPRGDPTHWSLNNQVRARCWRRGAAGGIRPPRPPQAPGASWHAALELGRLATHERNMNESTAIATP